MVQVAKVCFFSEISISAICSDKGGILIVNKNRMKRTSLTAKRGVIILGLLTVFVMGVLICRVGYLTLIKGDEYKKKAEVQQLSVSTLDASRGTIYDCNMRVLAQSASVWLCHINPSKVTDENREAVIKGLSNILEVDADKLRSDIEANSDRGYLKVKSEVEYNKKSELINYIVDNKLTDVIFFDPDTKRYYPDGTLASTVLGFTGSDGNGLIGLEYYYDKELQGTNGRVVTAQDGKQTELDNAYEVTYDPINGENFVLTLNSEIQTILRNALKTAYVDNDAANVYGIVMNTKTGAILAQCNYPDYDSNNPYDITDEHVLETIEKETDKDKKDELINDAYFSQWKNKSIADFYYPGSVFKVFLVSAALEEGVITDSTQYNCTGTISIDDRTVKDYNPIGHGLQTPRELLVNSCNTFSVVVGQKLGIERFYKYFEAFGFTEKTGVDLSGEGQPAVGVTYHSPDVSFSNSDLISSSFGQSNAMTPLQIITAVSAIGNGGKLMTPYIVKKTVDKAGNTIRETEPKVKRQVISESTASLVSSYMEDVVKDGTGKNAYVSGYRVAGKTGTSEKVGSEDTAYVASFAGFAPCEDPEISVIIVIDEPKAGSYSGGVIASPVAGEVFEKSLRYLGIEPRYSEEELEKLSEPAPDLIGMTVDEAKAALSHSGHGTKITGTGNTVTAQSPEPGRTMPGNGIIILYTDDNAKKETGIVPDFTGVSVSQANQLAMNSGFNIKVSGSSSSGSEVLAYRQEYAAGTELELGSIITVYFKTVTGIID